MMKRVLIVGAGMGGLTAAIKLAQTGYDVEVLEARAETGGLASGQILDGMSFDAGPYILLDRPGLVWAFAQLGLELDKFIELRPIDSVYQVATADGKLIQFFADKERTAAGFEALWPGSARRYLDFIERTARVHQELEPMLHVSRPGLAELVKARALLAAPFLLRSLSSVLAATGLPAPLVNAIGIWTHVAGQSISEAPSPLAFVPALIHTAGAFYPAGGIAQVPRVLSEIAAQTGVKIRFNTIVKSIRCEAGRANRVELASGESLNADAIISNYSGIGTYLDLVKDLPPRSLEKLKALPLLALQSPGVCAYLAIRGRIRKPYLRFTLPGGGELCRLLILPSVMAPELEQDGWHPARLLAPMRHAEAEALGEKGQCEFLTRIVAEKWWRGDGLEYRLLGSRIPAQWGAEFNLYRNSMNPVMTASFMRAGRIAHRSPHLRGLYLAGSSTHPGQWVSFCAMSGVLCAAQVQEDFAGA